MNDIDINDDDAKFSILCFTVLHWFVYFACMCVQYIPLSIANCTFARSARISAR
jgi:hypothetical protein